MLDELSLTPTVKSSVMNRLIIRKSELKSIAAKKTINPR